MPTVTPARRAIGERVNYLKEGLMDTLKLNNSLIPHALFSVTAMANNSLLEPSCYRLYFIFVSFKLRLKFSDHQFSSDNIVFFSTLKIRVHSAFLTTNSSIRNLIRTVFTVKYSTVQNLGIFQSIKQSIQLSV